MPKILIFADLHGGRDIRGKGGKKINTHGSQYLGILEGIKKLAKGENIDAIINLGDLSAGDNLEDFIKNHKTIKSIVDTITGLPIYHIYGNHEELQAGNSIGDTQAIFGVKGPESFVLGNTQHILLDLELGLESGKIPESSIDYLLERLESFNGESYVYHHYSVTQNPENISYYHKPNPVRSFSQSSERVKEIIKKYRVKAYFSGHTHISYTETIDTVQHITVPSISEDSDGVPDGRVGILDTNAGEFKLVSAV